MKRRSYGVNLDDGVELWSDEDFERLYVPARPEEARRLGEWLADRQAGPLIYAGQIGSGKTTLLNAALRQTHRPGLVRVAFDQTPLEETQGAFITVLFGALLDQALAVGCDGDGLGISLSDLDSPGPDNWQALRDRLITPPPDVKMARWVRSVYSIFDETPEQGQRICAALIQRIEAATGEAPVIIAEGVDKFDIPRAGYLGLNVVLDFLADYGTLYEANAVHLFDAGRRWVASDKLFIGPFGSETLVGMFEKRLGNYASLYRQDFSLLIEYSGGNARQALRLLNAYYFRRTQRRNDCSAAIALATHQVTQDLLQFGFDAFPADLLAVFKRDGYAEAAVLARPETAPAARTILYRNWAFLQSTPSHGTNRWPIEVNPLVSGAVALERTLPEAPELKAARQWARDRQISPMGLSLPEDEKGITHGWEEVWEQLSGAEPFTQLHIAGLLEEIASSLFSENRQDRIMVSYRDAGNIDIALDYLLGKASMSGAFQCIEIHLRGGEEADPIPELMASVKRTDNATIYTVFMEGDWTPAQLDALERLRDRFISVQLIWFVEYAAVLRYLRHWPQFRQLLRFYVLEDDFLAPLTKEEIEEDLSVLKTLSGPEDEGIHRLRHVLQYLEGRGRAA